MPISVAILTTDKREHDKDYANPTPAFGAAPEALLEGFALLPDVEIHIVSCVQKPMTAPKKLADNIWFHCLHVPKIGWMRTLYLGCVRATREKLRQIRPDIVHGQGTERDCALAAVRSGLPNVLTIHGNMKGMANFFQSYPGSFHWLAARLETLALRKAGGVFCNSAYTESLVSPRARRTWRVPNPVRTAFFDPIAEQPAAAQFKLLNVGVLSPYKRQSEILDVARNLWKRGLPFEMQFVGKLDAATGYGADFKRKLAEAEAAGYARHLGALPVDRLIAVMDGANAMVHFPREESFGLVVAEALARNLKLFAASIGGIPDIAAGVEAAELLPESDWTGLENALARWMESGAPRPRGAATVMRQRYHPELIARRHVEIYREVIASRS